MDLHLVWHLYIVQCRDGTLYTGISTDVQRRVAAHSAGRGAKYTRPRKRRPVQLLYTRPCGTKSAALIQERQVKALRRADKLKLIDSKHK